MLWKWLFKKLKKKSSIGTAVMAVSSFVLLFGIMVFILILFIFGTDDSQWFLPDDERVVVEKVGPVQTSINLGDVKYRPKHPSWDGELFTGYNDPRQKAMARELLELYGRVAEKQETLLQKGISKDKLIEVILGIQLAEVDTYSWKNYRKLNDSDSDSEKPKQTYIPLGFVKWSDYGRVQTAMGETMNFANYGWMDFKSRYDIENPNNIDPGIDPAKETNSNYRWGFNYSTLRSYTGAIGPFQQQPGTWSALEDYVAGNLGNATRQNPHWIKDIEGFVRNSHKDKGRAEDYNGDGVYDIFNQGDQALAVLEWYAGIFAPSQSNPLKTKYGADISDADLVQAHFGYNYFAGNFGSIDPYFDIYNKDIKSILNDQSAYQKAREIYKKVYGHGVEEEELIYQLYEARGWTRRSSGGVTKTVDGATITLSKNGTIYPIRTVFQGKAWYEFLRGIAYGGQTSQETGGTSGLNKVRYNYMTDADGTIKLDMATRTKALDKKMAIGYKGNIPIYDQNSSYMKQFRMLYPPDKNGEWTFYRGACTVFTMTSLYYATGDYTLPLNHVTVDLNRDGIIDPVEFWGQGRQFAGEGIKPMNPKDFSSTQRVGTVTIREILRGVGYTVANTSQGSVENNADVLEKLKQKIPVHIRIIGNRKVSALVPIQKATEIDYNTFDMYDINNYKEGAVSLANWQHSVLGVEARQFNGEWYISIINSTGHHTSGVDTNISWFKASSILADKYTNGYTIVGSSVDSAWKPSYLGGNFEVANEDISEYQGVYYSHFLDNLVGVDYYFQDSQTIRVEPSDTTINVVKVAGGYATKSVGHNKMYVYLGQTGGMQTALEITNVRNPRTNNTGDISSNEYTNLFDVQYGDIAYVRLGTFDEDGIFIYESFYDDNE